MVMERKIRLVTENNYATGLLCRIHKFLTSINNVVSGIADRCLAHSLNLDKVLQPYNSR